MANLFYEIFNNRVELTPSVTDDFLKDAETLYTKFIVDGDIDNLKVLKNKIEHLLDDKLQNADKKEKSAYEEIYKFLEKIDEYLEKKAKEVKKPKLIDVVGEVEKDYKKCADISEENRKNYSKVCVKKSKINYEKELIQLQVELLKLQRYIKEN
jgi:acetyl-CoA carboxylase alpha subunit